MVPEKMVGQTVLQVDLRKNFGVNIIAVENGKTLLESVVPDYTFRAGDILFLSGSRASLNQLADWAR